MLAPLLALVVLAQPTSWKDIDALTQDGKYDAASKLVTERLTAARAAKDDEEVARALIRRAFLRMSQGGLEAGINELKAEAWPTALVPRALVEAYYASALDRYASAFVWTIARREKLQSQSPKELTQLTAEELHAEIDRAWAAPWEHRDALGAVPLSSLTDFLTPNDFPKGVRDTLRDFVTLSRASALAASESWTEAQRNELYRVPLEPLLGTGAPKGEHPLVKAVALLADLEAWHAKAGQREGALFARVSRLQALYAAYSDDGPRSKIVAALLARIDADAALPLSAWARSIAAEWLRVDGALAKARDVAAVGARAFPASVGGKACAALVARLEAPEFSLIAPLSDGPRHRSLSIDAKNLSKLYFRAFTVDADKLLGRSWTPLPDSDRLRKVLTQRPVATWSADLAATPDLQLHRTHVTPPLDAPGAYLVAASALESFADEANQVSGVFFIVTDLVMTSSEVPGGVDVVVRDGASGAPVRGVDVTMYANDSERPRRTVGRATTDAQGFAHVKGPAGDETKFLVARKGAQLAVDPSQLYLWHPERAAARNSALLYTDRAIYRPGQVIHWKVVAWHGDAGSEDLRVAAGARVDVMLRDANYQQVEVRTVKTNELGSASGEFTIPPGRMLGAWQLSARDASTTVRVEEYKRPTFEVAFKDSGAAMRLNAPVRLTGEARYYFGLPVTAGTVRWRVKREPVFPWWYGWWKPQAQQQTVASGSASLGADGTFSFDFTPAADPSQPRDVTFRFSVEADVTEDGGETRTAKKTTQLGFTSVQASFDVNAGFLRADVPASVVVHRTNLDGDGRAGTGTWRLVELRQPSAPVAWADEPVERSPFEKKPALVTPGDEVRARANARADVDATLRRWPDGRQLAQGDVTHDASGDGVVKLPALPAGAYRLRYETKDEAGAVLRVATELVVAGPTAFPLAVPAWLRAESNTAHVGQPARFLVGSAYAGQPLLFEVVRDGRVLERRWLTAGKDPVVIERPTTKADRGGYGVRVSVVHDWGVATFSERVDVPWDDKALTVEFASFRDTLRPGAKETFRVTVKSQGALLEPRTAELLASMYDKSLDVFAPFSPPRVDGLYREHDTTLYLSSSLASVDEEVLSRGDWYRLPEGASFTDDILGGAAWGGLGMSGVGFGGGGIGIGGIGTRGRGGLAYAEKRMNTIQVIRGGAALAEAPATTRSLLSKPGPSTGEPTADAEPVRSNFAETALFAPHLLVGEHGEVSFEVTAPDSVTAWNLWVSAITKDLRGGYASVTVRTVKELLVRPALPRFLREGDQAALKVVVNDAGKTDLTGEVRVELFDPVTEKSVLAEFGLKDAPLPFSVKAGQSTTLTVPLVAPRRVGEVAVRIVAKAGGWSDGELRTLPLFPSRMHLAQSRFVTLKDASTRTMSFASLLNEADPTRIDEQLVVTVDGQLFTTVLAALPYLTRYPYECTEQTLNRFLSTGIVASVFRDHPSVAKAAKALSKRKTKYEPFDRLDPNRKAGLEETPWLTEAAGGPDDDLDLVAMLDPAAVEAERSAALEKLMKMQLPDGGFPWFPGGRASPGMTLYLLQGFARAAEFKVPVPRDVVTRAWRSVGAWNRDELSRCLKKDDCSVSLVTLLVHTASAYPDESWLGGALSSAQRQSLLDYSFRHWRAQSPYLKSLLALALHRAGRKDDAKLVFDSVMDSAKTTPDEGTFWQPGDHGWLWYEDTVESHAFALRTLMELSPKDPRKDGLVQWLLLNKKLNHWKSTRASAEAIYALVKYFADEKSLGLREVTTVTVGPLEKQLVFEPGSGAREQQVVVAGKQLDPKTMSAVTVSKDTKGFQFASATWHFSTDRLPEKASGDLFQVTRAYFKRVKQGAQVTLEPLKEGARVEPGDEVEVQLSIRARQAAEYVHLRDPRGAGFEPDVGVSRYRYDSGLSWYEELRDSGTNFFFESLPPGQYTLKYRVRAAMGGRFRVGPATLQSMYAPEFNAYSAGNVLTVGTGGR